MISVKHKLFLIGLILFVSLLYSYPNLYGETPALLIKSDKIIDEQFINVVNKFFDSKNIKSKSIKLEDKTKLIIKFFSTEDQFSAYELFKAKKIPVSLSLNILNNNVKFFEIIKSWPMKLGLDLRGGVHFLLKVNSDAIIDRITQVNLDLIKKNFYHNKIQCKIFKSKNNKMIKLVFNEYTDISFAKKFLKDYLIDFNVNYTSGLIVKLNLNKEHEIKQNAMELTISILAKRISELGISDYIIQQNGSDKIAIELPGIQDILYAKYILGKTATIKFMLVDDIDAVLSGANKNKILYTKDKMPVMLKNNEVLNGSYIISAVSGFDNNLHKPCVNVKVNNEGAQLFRKITKANIGKLIAIVYKEYVLEDVTECVQETVINIAKIMSELSNSFQITGLNMQESKDLSLLLRSGSLPTSIFIIEEKLIGPTLGEKNISNGFKFIFISILSIFLFMIFKYRIFGIIASFSLFINFLLLVAIMSIFGVILTLPGLAGIALTIGISIDGNVLIFERIKEEMKLLTFNDAIDKGFARAFNSIFDSNMTTFLIAFILFIFAGGPVKCFSLALSVGILTSFYSSIFVTKTIIDFVYNK